MIVMAAHIRLIVDRHFIDIDDSGKSASYIIFRIPSVQTLSSEISYTKEQSNVVRTFESTPQTGNIRFAAAVIL